MSPRSWVGSIALLGCVGCATQTATIGTPRPPRAADCALQVVTRDGAKAAGLEQVGVVSLSAPRDAKPFEESIRKRVQPKACAMGGEAVSLTGAGGGFGPIGQGIAFAVWAKRGAGNAGVWGGGDRGSSRAAK
ncbi:MAG: hypothetical protein ACHREM_26160 [Polyangiales bacterium]